MLGSAVKTKTKTKPLTKKKCFLNQSLNNSAHQKFLDLPLPIWQLFTQVGWLAEDIYMYRATKQ